MEMNREQLELVAVSVRMYAIWLQDMIDSPHNNDNDRQRWLRKLSLIPEINDKMVALQIQQPI